jgi:hypothetical protein
VAWATHLGLHAVMLPAPRFNSTNYSHVINHVVSNLSYMQAWVKIPLVAPEVLLQVTATTSPPTAAAIVSPVCLDLICQILNSV